MKKLRNISLVAVATTEVEATAKALRYSQNHLQFDRVLLLAPFDPEPDSRHYEFIRIDPFRNVGEWGKFIVFDLHSYISTDHIILIHSDGFIVNPESWNDEFLKYDYIGAPWPIPKDNFSYRDHLGNIIRVGNSVSLRSLKLLKLPSQLKLDWSVADHGFFHEDGFLCVQSRHVLQSHGIAYAPLHIACQFSHEKPIPENKGIRPFAFHKWEGSNRHYPRFSPKASLRHRIQKLMKKLKQRI